MEQYNYRKEACPKCAVSYETWCCGCAVPAVFFSTKACKNGRYPELLNRKNWSLFKSNKQRWERFIDSYPGGEKELDRIGIKHDTKYNLWIITDILDGALSEEQEKALLIYRKSQFITIVDTNPDIVLPYE